MRRIESPLEERERLEPPVLDLRRGLSRALIEFERVSGDIVRVGENFRKGDCPFPERGLFGDDTDFPRMDLCRERERERRDGESSAASTGSVQMGRLGIDLPMPPIERR